MNYKTKFIVPLALTIILPFSSCATNHGKDVTIPRLDRVSYKSVHTFTDLNGVFNKIHDKQMYNEDSEPDFTIFDKGTVNVKYKVKLTGSIEVDYSNNAPIVINNLDTLLTDNITISWDCSENTRYIKIATSNGSQYIGKEGNNWYRYYNSPINDNKYKTPIDFMGSDITDFHYLILNETFYDLTIPLDFSLFNDFLDMYDFYDRIGFDLSGFLRDGDDNNRWVVSSRNILSPGYYGMDSTTTTDVDKLLAAGFVEGLTAQFGTNDEKTASIDFKLDKVDLSVWSPILSVLSNAVLSGTMDFDYFAAYADYFIHQQEISCNIKDMNLSALLDPIFVNNAAREPGFVNVSNLNLDFIANEEVTQDCTPDTYNPSDYHVIQ